MLIVIEDENEPIRNCMERLCVYLQLANILRVTEFTLYLTVSYTIQTIL